MTFILILVMRPMFLMPESISITAFDSKETCELALYVAREEWTVVNGKSRCVDLAFEKNLKDAKKALDKTKVPL